MPLQKLHKRLTQTIYEALYRSAFIALGMTLLFFSGCSKEPSKHDVVATTTTLRLSNAKHFDIPQPLGFTAATRQSAASGDYLIYTGTQSRPKVIDFYLHAMESNGWELQNFSNNFEGLLVCIKPHKTCTISIRTEKENTYVHVFVKQQQAIS